MATKRFILAMAMLAFAVTCVTSVTFAASYIDTGPIIISQVDITLPPMATAGETPAFAAVTDTSGKFMPTPKSNKLGVVSEPTDTSLTFADMALTDCRAREPTGAYVAGVCDQDINCNAA